MSLIPPAMQNLAPRKPRVGCLGCLLKAVWGLFLTLILGIVTVAGMTALLFPWAFYLGGKFHITPYWQGLGKLHAKSGDYVLFLRIEPTTRGSRMYAHSNLSGVANLCTPRGEQLPLHLGGTMRPHLNLSTDGEAIEVYVYYWPWNGSFITDHRPSLDFRGHWRNPNLEMDDHGSLAKAFQADASVNRGTGRPSPPEVVPVTFAPGSYSDYKAACGTIRR